MDQKFIQKLAKAHQATRQCASPEAIGRFFNELLGILFPEVAEQNLVDAEAINRKLLELKLRLIGIICDNATQNSPPGPQVANQFFDELPLIHQQIDLDVEAVYAGDPAATSKFEVIKTYPGFYAIASYRIAHSLHKQGLEIIPRIITEQAHSKTGIDIHPGAKIGHHFCIDHGTGVVIGETTEIGNWVKLYQGVTLGALSISKDDAQTKRHPTIGDHVVIYAGATILGGETVVGDHSVIGGNVWLVRSVPAHSKIYYQARMHHEEQDSTDLVVIKKILP